MCETCVNIPVLTELVKAYASARRDVYSPNLPLSFVTPSHRILSRIVPYVDTILIRKTHRLRTSRSHPER